MVTPSLTRNDAAYARNPLSPEGLPDPPHFHHGLLEGSQMRKLLLAISVLVVVVSAASAGAQSGVRREIRDGDVYSYQPIGFGFMRWQVAWTKNADFDILIEGITDGQIFTTCSGQSFDTAFELCEHGLGADSYLMTIFSLDGATSAKGSLMIQESVPEDNFRGARRKSKGKRKGLHYVGNIYDSTSDPLLLEARSRAEARRQVKVRPDR